MNAPLDNIKTKSRSFPTQSGPNNPSALENLSPLHNIIEDQNESGAKGSL